MEIISVETDSFSGLSQAKPLEDPHIPCRSPWTTREMLTPCPYAIHPARGGWCSALPTSDFPSARCCCQLSVSHHSPASFAMASLAGGMLAADRTMLSVLTSVWLACSVATTLTPVTASTTWVWVTLYLTPYLQGGRCELFPETGGSSCKKPSFPQFGLLRLPTLDHGYLKRQQDLTHIPRASRGAGPLVCGH